MEPARLYRPLTGKLQLHTPFIQGTRGWLTETVGNRAVSGGPGGKWEIARSHFNRSFITALADRFGRVMVRHEMREGSAKCVTECANANIETAWKCECVCLGDNHGMGGSGWTHVGERLLVNAGVVVLVTTVYRKQSHGRSLT